MKDNARVIALPPIIFAAHLALGLLLHWFSPISAIPAPKQVLWAVGSIIAIISGILALSARSAMKQADTAIDPREATTRIVSDGVFRISRNPMYLSLVLLLLGIAVGLNSVWLLLVCPPFVLVIHYGVVLREEHYLENKFEDSYRQYKERVRRWI